MALRNLELHRQDFLRDSQDSQMFGAEDRMLVETNYNQANQHYNTMVSSAEQGGRCLLCSTYHCDLCYHQLDTLTRPFSLFSLSHFSNVCVDMLSQSFVCELTVGFTLQAMCHPEQVRCFILRRQMCSRSF